MSSNFSTQESFNRVSVAVKMFIRNDARTVTLESQIFLVSNKTKKKYFALKPKKYNKKNRRFALISLVENTQNVPQQSKAKYP